MIYVNVVLFIFVLFGLHFRDKLNNWSKFTISLLPIFLNAILLGVGVEASFVDLLIPFIYTYLIVDQREREVYEVIPYGILLLPININLKIIAFSACTYFNFTDFKLRSLPILKLTIIIFLCLVDKTASFKYVFSFYLLLSLLETSNDDFSVTDGVIISYLLMSNIQFISETLNYSLMSLSFLIFILLINKKNIFRTIFIFSSIVCVLLNMENYLMAMVLFYYVSKTFVISLSLLKPDVSFIDKFLYVKPFTNIIIIGLFSLAFALNMPSVIIAIFIMSSFIFLLESDSLIDKIKDLQWYEFLYSVSAFLLIATTSIYYIANIFNIDTTYFPYAIGCYFIISLVQALAIFKFPKHTSFFAERLNIDNSKRASYLDNIFRQPTIHSITTTHNNNVYSIGLSYRSVRTLSLLVISLYFLSLIFKVVN